MYLGGFRERKWECVCAFWRVEALLLYEREREGAAAAMATALRRAILGHMRVAVAHPISVVSGSNKADKFRSLLFRPFSSHGDDHLTKDQVTERVLSVIKDFPKVDPSKVTPDVHFQKDLGLDSLDNVELVMALEEEFKLEIPDLEADKIDSTKLAIEYIHNHPMAS